jgi:hypothetical protein
VTAIPGSFLGFSTEYWELPVDERQIALYKRLVSLLHVRGDKPFVLRIGGDSSDHTFWDPGGRTLPRWAFGVTPAWVSRAARVVRQMRLRVIIDLNTVTSTRRLAVEWAQAAAARLPRGSIIGFEIGNEPDVYDRELWADNLGGGALNLLPGAVTSTSYARGYDSYARALVSVAPHMPLLGPALANPYRDRAWVSTLLSGSHPGLGAVSLHRYPYSACSPPRWATFPTVARILSERASAGTAQAIRPAIRLAHRAGIPVRLTELNSVTCGGLPHVSDTFATALWAPDTLFELARAGVQGVNLHVRRAAINAPFRFAPHGVAARPLLYGLILFSRMLGPRSRLVAVQLHADRALHLKLWAVREGRDRLNLLLIDKGAQAATVRLRLPTTGPVAVQRLLAPSARSETHVTLAGQWLGAAVRWQGRRVIEEITSQAGHYSLHIGGLSAALLSFRVAPATLAASAAR